MFQLSGFYRRFSAIALEKVHQCNPYMGHVPRGSSKADRKPGQCPALEVGINSFVDFLRFQIGRPPP